MYRASESPSFSVTDILLIFYKNYPDSDLIYSYEIKKYLQEKRKTKNIPKKKMREKNGIHNNFSTNSRYHFSFDKTMEVRIIIQFISSIKMLLILRNIKTKSNKKMS